jgi:hypothetical protein
MAQTLDIVETRTHKPTKTPDQSLATRASPTDNIAEGVKLMPNSRTLCVERIKAEVTLLESMLLTDHRQVGRVTRGLILPVKVIPHLKNSSRTHKLRDKLGQNTSSERNLAHASSSHH